MNALYASFKEKMRNMADLSNAIGVLTWDNEVNLPAQSNILRAQQIATLSGLAHQQFTDKSFGKLLKALQNEKLPFKQQRDVEIVLKDFKRDQKFTREFVIEKSTIVSKAYHSWAMAKAKNDFFIFEKSLDELIHISRKEVEILGYENHPYNALIDLYEPGMSVQILDTIFDDVKAHLIPFITKVKAIQPSKPTFLNQKFAKDDQWAFGLRILKSIGYNFEKGRQDISSHPFTIGFGSDDVRITTRIDEKDISNMTWSCIHEGGHALYEQGLYNKHYGLPSGTAASLGIHESQSRMWENNIGRSKSFWKHQLPILKQFFPNQLKGISLDQFFNAINHIAPGKIRTEADELHYHLHVMIRYEIEKEIFQSKIKARDIRALWNSLYKKYLGVTLTNDEDGILQDVHWSHGSFGYFPTYSLGSFYAAQFFYAIKKTFPQIELEISKGDYAHVHQWLKENIYRHGKTYAAEVLCKKATGSSLNFKYFMDYVTEKYNCH